MKKILLRTGILLVVALSSLVVVQVSRFYVYLKRTDYQLKPFEQHPKAPLLNILFLGDSTAVGTGAKSNQETVAGYFGRQYPQASIDNFSRNGRKLGELLDEYDFKPKTHYQLIVIQIGGNDILRFTALDSVKRDLDVLMRRVRPLADHVVVLHSGNVGIAPLFIWPFNELLSLRTRALRAIYKEVVKTSGAIYVDLYHARGDDPLNKNIDLNYSLDYLHPSGQGYLSWYQRIQQTLIKSGITL